MKFLQRVAKREHPSAGADDALVAMARIESDMVLLTWMLAVNIVLSLATLVALSFTSLHLL
jgi:hypothetical protein